AWRARFRADRADLSGQPGRPSRAGAAGARARRHDRVHAGDRGDGGTGARVRTGDRGRAPRLTSMRRPAAEGTGPSPGRRQSALVNADLVQTPVIASSAAATLPVTSL